MFLHMDDGRYDYLHLSMMGMRVILFLQSPPSKCALTVPV